MKKYSLTKSEIDKIQSFVGQVAFFENVLNSIQGGYRHFMVSELFKRLSIDEKEIKNAQINIAKGELIIKKDAKVQKQTD